MAADEQGVVDLTDDREENEAESVVPAPLQAVHVIASEQVHPTAQRDPSISSLANSHDEQAAPGLASPVAVRPDADPKASGGGGSPLVGLKRDREEDATCTICLQPFDNSGPHRVAALACGHLFGKDCVRSWLKEGKKTCPTCNKAAKVDDVRMLFAVNLVVQDTAERDAARAQLEKEKRERKKAEAELGRAMMHIVMLQVRLHALLAAPFDLRGGTRPGLSFLIPGMPCVRTRSDTPSREAAHLMRTALGLQGQITRLAQEQRHSHGQVAQEQRHCHGQMALPAAPRAVRCSQAAPARNLQVRWSTTSSHRLWGHFL